MGPRENEATQSADNEVATCSETDERNQEKLIEKTVSNICHSGAEKGNVSVPVLLNSSGTLLERGQCYELDGIQFAVTNISVQQQKSEMLKGAVILNGKIDESVQICMPVDKKIQSTRPILDRKDKDFLKSISFLNKDVQREILESESTVRHLVRRSVVGSHMRKEVATALSSRSQNRRFSLGVCSLEHDIDLFGIDPKLKKTVYSYQKDNIGALDNLLGCLWDIKEISDSQFRFVTQVVVKLKGFQLIVAVSTAVSRLPFSEIDYRNKIKLLELVPVESQTSDCEEVDSLD